MSKKIILSGLLCAFLALVGVRPLRAQAQAFGTGVGEVPPLEVGAYYAFLYANAPPASCGCFSINGGGGTLIFNMPYGISAVADLSGGHANAVDGTSQNISLFNYVFGLRYSYRRSHRFTPYVQGLGGRSLEMSNYAFVQSVSGFAAMGGGGVDIRLTKLLGWDVQADYIYSQLPNGSNNRQSTLRISTGVLFRFGPR